MLLDVCDGPLCPNCGCQDSAEVRGGKRQCLYCRKVFRSVKPIEQAADLPSDVRQSEVTEEEPEIGLP